VKTCIVYIHRILFASGKEKLGFLKEGEVVIVTEYDGTEVDQDIFGELLPSTVFIIKDKDLIWGI